MNIEALTKAEQRKYFLAKRNSISNEDIELKSKVIAEHFFGSKLYESVNTVMAYVSIKSEVRTEKLIKKLIEDKGRVIIPKCEVASKTLKTYSVSDFSHLTEGAYNILEPNKEKIINGEIKEIKKTEIDAVITPAAAFDSLGFRLGYGAGYYDRFFEDYTGIKVGFEFSDCICGRISAENDDVPVDVIFSEQGCMIINDAYRL